MGDPEESGEAAGKFLNEPSLCGPCELVGLCRYFPGITLLGLHRPPLPGWGFAASHLAHPPFVMVRLGWSAAHTIQGTAQLSRLYSPLLEDRGGS